MIREITTVPSFNPDFQDWLIVSVKEPKPKVFFIPEKEFTDLLIEAGRRFNSIAPLAPYPNLLGCVWKTNNTIFRWFVKRLEAVQKKYEWALEDP